MQDLKDITREVHYENFRALHIRDQQAHGSEGTSRGYKTSAGTDSAEADQLLRQKEAEVGEYFINTIAWLYD